MGRAPLLDRLADELVAPICFAERYDVVLLAPDEKDPGVQTRILAAALGLCSPTLRRQLHYEGRALEHGAAVVQELTLASPHLAPIEVLARIRALGLEALRLCSEGLLGAKEVEAARGNSGAGEPPAPSSPAGA